MAEAAHLLEVEGLKKYFPVRKGLLRRTVGQRAFRICDALQIAILYLHQLGGILRSGGAVGYD